MSLSHPNRVALAALLLALPVTAQGPAFAVSSTTVAAEANAVALADFDGDAVLDLAVADGAGVVRLRTGNGDGTFTTAGSLGLPGDGIAVSFGFVDGDAHVDLVAGTSNARLVAFLGDGAGGFTQSSISFSTPGGTPPDPSDIALADVTGDGLTDIVAANFFANSVSVLAGDGLGDFGTAVAYGLPGLLLRSATLLDADGDSDLDIATVGGGTPVRMLLNDGSGNFTEQPHLGVAGWQVRAADLDGDGAQDLIVAGGVADALVTFPGNGDGTFGAPVSSPAGFQPLGVALGHFDTDGELDAAAPTSSSARVGVLLGSGAGDFSLDSAHPNTGDAFSLAAGDLDGDGLDDLVCSDTASGQVTVLLNLGAGQSADEGGALAQADGLVAHLTGVGPYTAGSANSLELAFARSSTTTNAVLGFSLLAAPFKGGTLMPFPDKIVFNLPVDAVGNSSLPFVWPAGVPSGFETRVQHWFADASNPSGFAASNGVVLIAD